MSTIIGNPNWSGEGPDRSKVDTTRIEFQGDLDLEPRPLVFDWNPSRLLSSGERLRAFREHHGLTMAECARAARVAPETWRRWEHMGSRDQHVQHLRSALRIVWAAAGYRSDEAGRCRGIRPNVRPDREDDPFWMWKK